MNIDFFWQYHTTPLSTFAVFCFWRYLEPFPYCAGSAVSYCGALMVAVTLVLAGKLSIAFTHELAAAKANF